MYNYEWAFFDKSGNKLPSIVTSESTTYAAGDVKNHNGKYYKIVHRIINRINDCDFHIAVEV
jgi:hypothetical protein